MIKFVFGFAIGVVGVIAYQDSVAYVAYQNYDPRTEREIIYDNYMARQQAYQNLMEDLGLMRFPNQQ